MFAAEYIQKTEEKKMKNITKILFALMLCLAVVFATVACNEEKKDEGTSGDAEKEATEALENCLDAAMELDFDEAQDYMLDADGELDGIDKDYLLEMLMEEKGGDIPEEYKDELEDMCEKFFDLALDNFSYKIEKTEVKSDDEVVFEVKLTVPDVDFNLDFDEEYAQELVVDLYNKGKINESMSEQEVYDVLIPEIFDAMYEEIKKSIDTETKTTDVTVVKKDGKWYVDPKGEFDELLEVLNF